MGPTYNMGMDNFPLSEHFGFYEMTNSAEHPDMVEGNRRAARAYLRNLRVLCEALLEEVRDEFGVPVVILSGFRSPELNAAVGGSVNSQHMRGEAADFTVPGLVMARVFAWFKLSGLIWHQLIYYPDRNFIHVSLPTGHNDGQVIVK